MLIITVFATLVKNSSYQTSILTKPRKNNKAHIWQKKKKKTVFPNITSRTPFSLMGNRGTYKPVFCFCDVLTINHNPARF